MCRSLGHPLGVQPVSQWEQGKVFSGVTSDTDNISRRFFSCSVVGGGH